MFPDDASRLRAIEAIERGIMPRSILGVLHFLFSVFLFLSVPAAISYLIVAYVLPPLGPWNNRIMVILALGGYTAIVYLMLRRNMPKALRQQLLECGVPVCLGCGYDLRGSPPGAGRCPECGKKLDERARELMVEAVVSSDDPSSRAPRAAPGSEPAR